MAGGGGGGDDGAPPVARGFVAPQSPLYPAVPVAGYPAMPVAFDAVNGQRAATYAPPGYADGGDLGVNPC